MKALKITTITIAILLAIGSGLYVSGYGGQLAFMAFLAYNKPVGEFEAEGVTDPVPDYSRSENWAALPAMEDPSDLVPEGIDRREAALTQVDTFFIHPTGFLTSGSWTSPMNPNSGTEENTKWMMANQASAYNGCCDVYAPRYREANIFSYFGEEEVRDQVLGFAYADVKRAFDYYLESYNEGRPFILASHSQGTHHAMRLISEVIDESDLRDRMVAAYIIGAVVIPLSPDWFAGLTNVKPCESADDLGCVIHWDTMPEGGKPMERSDPSLCTNPLTWSVDEEKATADLNVGAVYPEGTYNVTFGREEDVPKNEKFEQLAEPVPELTGAQCRDGSLFASTGGDDRFSAMGEAMTNSYHGLDYALFYMNIRENAQLRSRTYLAQAAARTAD